MNQKDSIEELFRNAVEENSPQDKPRDIVWQKIETGLQQNKTKKPLHDFIQSVWSSAAVFALIAIPYFYFFIENMNEGDEPIEIVKESVHEILEKVPVIVQQTKPPGMVDPEVQMVKKSTIPTKKQSTNGIATPPSIESSSDMMLMNASAVLDEETLKDQLKDSTRVLMAASKVSENVALERKNLDSIASTAIVMAKVDSKEIEKRSFAAPAATTPSASMQKPLDPIVFNRNRIVLQTKVDRVSLMYVKKQNNKVIFEKDNKRFSITRKNGQVELSTNSDKFKKDLLQILINNKENIFNYYINIPVPK